MWHSVPDPFRIRGDLIIKGVAYTDPATLVVTGF